MIRPEIDPSTLVRRKDFWQMNMMHEPASEPDEIIIDKRIVKEEYRNYDLVARFWEYGYLGKIWKNRKAIDEIDAIDDEGIDDLIVKMKQQVDQFIAEKQEARANQPPTQAELVAAFKQVSDKISILERLVLKHHAECPNGVFEMEKIQRLAGYSSSTSVLMTYSNVAQRLCNEIGYEPKDSGDTPPSLSVLLKPLPKDQQSLTLKKDVIKAIRELNW